MAAPKRSYDKIQKDRADIARLYLQGIIQAEIGKRLGMSQQMVSYDLQAIRKEWLASSIRDFNEARAQELAKIDNLELTYWEAWERSCEDFKSKTVKQKGSKIERVDDEETKITPVEATQKSEGRNGNPAFLQGVERCIERRCKLLGFDAPQKHDVILEDAGLSDEDRVNRISAILDRARERRDRSASSDGYPSSS